MNFKVNQKFHGADPVPVNQQLNQLLKDLKQIVTDGKGIIADYQAGTLTIDQLIDQLHTVTEDALNLTQDCSDLLDSTKTILDTIDQNITDSDLSPEMKAKLHEKIGNIKDKIDTISEQVSKVKDVLSTAEQDLSTAAAAIKQVEAVIAFVKPVLDTIADLFKAATSLDHLANVCQNLIYQVQDFQTANSEQHPKLVKGCDKLITILASAEFGLQGGSAKLHQIMH